MSVKINSLELENIKRVKAVQLTPTDNGLTIIGGDNRQGKTSVLDAIVWALGGNKYAPSSPKREGSLTDPSLHIELNNGIIVERKGKNSSLKVIQADGNKAGQALLDSFIEEFALNLPKFMNANNKEKASILLQVIGVGEKLAQYELQEKQLYNQRQELGRIYRQKKSYAEELPFYPEAPTEPVSPLELIKQQQAILAKNGENQQKRDKLAYYEQQHERISNDIELKKAELKALEVKLAEVLENLNIANTAVQDLVDESTAEIEQNLADIELINAKVRTNANREQAEEDANNFKAEYDSLSDKLIELRDKRTALLDGANLPLEGLSVVEGELTYNGCKWDAMSGADQLIVATAIVRKLNPECGFVLMDKLEQMDLTTLNTFGDWCKQEDLQVIATRVSQGSECEIIIEDGYVKEAIADKTWKGGTF